MITTDKSGTLRTSGFVAYKDRGKGERVMFLGRGVSSREIRRRAERKRKKEVKASEKN